MVCPLVGSCAVINAQVSSIVAVPIAVEGATAKPSDVLRRGWHLEAEAKLGQDGTFYVRSCRGADADCSVGIDAELLDYSKCQGRSAGPIGVSNRELNPLLSLILLNFPGATLHRQSANTLGFPVAFLSLVVLRWHAESVELNRLTDEDRAVEDILGKRPSRECDGEVLTLDGISGARACHDERV